MVTDHVLVLRTVEYGERDIILTLLGRETGKFSAIAKGGKASRRRFAGALDLFRISEMTFRQRGGDSLALLTEATVQRAFTGLERSFDKIAIASYYTELVREMVQEADPTERAFERVIEYYSLIEEVQDDPVSLELTLASGVLRWLGHAGLAPHLAGCYRCGVETDATDRAWFFSQQGEGAS